MPAPVPELCHNLAKGGGLPSLVRGLFHQLVVQIVKINAVRRRMSEVSMPTVRFSGPKERPAGGDRCQPDFNNGGDMEPGTGRGSNL